MATQRHASVRFLLSGSFAAFAMVLLTHVAERLDVLPGPGWGLPNSPGHYLDLVSAVSGIGLLVAAGLAYLLLRVPEKANKCLSRKRQR